MTYNIQTLLKLYHIHHLIDHLVINKTIAQNTAYTVCFYITVLFKLVSDLLWCFVFQYQTYWGYLTEFKVTDPELPPDKA